MAERLGKSYNGVNGNVQNRQQPRLEVLYEIAETLNVEVKDMLIERKGQEILSVDKADYVINFISPFSNKKPLKYADKQLNITLNIGKQKNVEIKNKLFLN